MATEKKKLNGSVDLLGDAMRKVVEEAAEHGALTAVKPLEGKINKLEKKIDAVGDQVGQLRRDVQQAGIPVT